MVRRIFSNSGMIVGEQALVDCVPIKFLGALKGSAAQSGAEFGRSDQFLCAGDELDFIAPYRLLGIDKPGNWGGAWPAARTAPTAKCEQLLVSMLN